MVLNIDFHSGTTKNVHGGVNDLMAELSEVPFDAGSPNQRRLIGRKNRASAAIREVLSDSMTPLI